MQSYGFVGAGEIAAAIVEGLSTGVADPPPIVLSPRNHDVAHGLAARFPNVRVGADNQEVLDTATVVVVAVRPQVAQEVLAQLAFRPEHVVVSVLAGVGLAQLREWVAPATRIVRSIPLPTASRASSRTAMYPDDAVARTLYESVGDVVVPGDEATLDAFSAATATFAAHLDQLATIATWMAEHGVATEDANGYVAHVYGELGHTLSQHDGTLEALAGKHMTPGGINEQFLAGLRRDGVPDLVRRGLDDVLARVKGQ